MATQVQFRRGTTTDISTFIGADGEVVVDTTKKTCVVHDGIQVAGYPLLREDGSNSALNAGNLSSCALKFINDPNTGIISPGADQVALVTGGASRLSIDSSGSVTIPGNLLVSGSLTGALTLDDGSAAVPALRFTNDPDTGIYLSGTNQVAISTGGTQRLTTTTTEVTSTLPVIHPLGAAATPSLTFAGDTNTGIYSSGSDQVAISTGGTQRLTTTTTEVTSTLPVIHPLGAAATPSLTFAGDTNTGIYSPGADQVAISTNGAESAFFAAGGGRLAAGAIDFNATTFALTGGGATEAVTVTKSGVDIISLGVDGSGPRITSGGDLRFLTNSEERLRITSAGRLGLGTSSPGAKLEIYTTGTYGTAYQPAVYITNSSSGGTLSANTGLGAIAWATDSNSTITSSIEAIRENPSSGAASALVLRTGSSGGGTERLRITSAGNVGIGTTGPNGLLDVRSATTWIGDGTTDAFLQFNQSATAADRWHIGTGSFSSNALVFYKGTYGTGSETARIDSSGRLLVGTSSGAAKLEVFTASDGDGIRLDYGNTPTGSAGPAIAFAQYNNASSVITTSSIKGIMINGAVGAEAGVLVFNTATGGTAPTERMRITSDAYVRLASGTGGIQFNADTAAANALDDYEEGTWTPTPLFGGASVGITYTTSPVGYYTKIGRLVHVQFGFRLSNKGSSTGDFSVAGLPFTVGGTGSFLHPTGSVNAHYLAATGIIVGSLGDGTIVRYRKLNDSTADTPLTDADFTNNVGFYQSLVYFV